MFLVLQDFQENVVKIVMLGKLQCLKPLETPTEPPFPAKKKN